MLVGHRGLFRSRRDGERAAARAIDRERRTDDRCGSRRSISISVGSGATQVLGNVIDNAPNDFPTPVSITLTWDLHPLTGSVQVLGYFTNPAAAMASGPVSIPLSWLKGRVLYRRSAGGSDHVHGVRAEWRRWRGECRW